MTVYVEKVRAMEIFDSRGNPTVEVRAFLSDGTVAKAEVPSGASTGEKEAVELRDGGKRLSGKGVLKAIENVNGPINTAVKGMSPFNQADIDHKMIELDGTPNKAKLGANAILGVSMAIARAASKSKKEPLYRYLGGVDNELPQTFHNVINGGKHADNGIDIQEFMITPVKKDSFRDGFEKIVNTYHTLKKVIEDAGFETGLGDEGGFAPNLNNSEEALKMLREAIIKAGYKPGEDIAIAFDAAASSFYNHEDGKYHFEGHVWNGKQMLEWYGKILKEFPEIIADRGGYFVKIDGNVLRQYRDEYSLSLKDLADLAHVSRATMYKYENGIVKANTETAMLLEEILNTKITIDIDILKPPENDETIKYNKSGEETDYLSKLGYNVVPTNKSPFDAAAKMEESKKNSPLIANIEKNRNEKLLTKMAVPLKDLSLITSSEPVFIINNEKISESLGDIPVIKSWELKEFEKSSELLKLIKERKEN